MTARRRVPKGQETPDGSTERAWSIQYWEDPEGRAHVIDWIRSELSPYEQAVLTAAISNVLRPLGIDICGTQWGKPLGDGLYEFRIRTSLRAITTWGQPSSHRPTLPAEPGNDVAVLFRLFVTFHGDRIVLLFSGYDKGKDPSTRRQNKEIRKARKALDAWRASRR